MPHPSQPKQILVSKRNNIYYIDRAKIMVSDGCVRILGNHTEKLEQYLNLPDKNTSLLLLGHGTSITNEAMRLLASSCVMVGFCGTGGTPTYAAADIVFSPYQDEYRPTEYMQKWAKIWFNDTTKLECAKFLLTERINHTVTAWEENDFLWDKAVNIDNEIIEKTLAKIKNNNDLQNLLLVEARWTKYLYKIVAEKVITVGKFVRKRDISKNDRSKQTQINMFLNHGNYLAYGIAATSLHVLGISFSFPMLHGKTRRGGLVLDIADLIKDPYVLPLAFEIGSTRTKKENIFRGKIIEIYRSNHAIDYNIDIIKKCIEKFYTNQ